MRSFPLYVIISNGIITVNRGVTQKKGGVLVKLDTSHLRLIKSFMEEKKRKKCTHTYCKSLVGSLALVKPMYLH